MPPPFVRTDLRYVERVVHGSVSEAELAAFGLRLADVCDFSVNTNPLGPASSVLSALTEADWTRYPGDDETAPAPGAGEAESCASDPGCTW